MKKFLFLFMIASLVMFVACEQDVQLNEEATEIEDIALIEAIANDDNKESIIIDQIPNRATNSLLDKYTLSDIEETLYANNLGYEVLMKDSPTQYFERNGGFLGSINDSIGNCSNGNKRAKRCLKGDTIAMEVLPQIALDYIAGNYPDQEVTLVVQNNEKETYGVEFADGEIILFDLDGNFIGNCGRGANFGGPSGNGGQFSGTEITVEELPQTVLDYLNDNHDISTIMMTFVSQSGKYKVILEDGTFLVFDEEGNLLDRPKRHRNGPGGE